MGENGGALVPGRQQQSGDRRRHDLERVAHCRAIAAAAWRRVSFVRNSTEPVTPLRPDDFKELARKILIRNGVPAPRSDVLDPADPEKEHTIKWQSEILFYRYSEIRKRAVLVNTRLHPDLVLCLHFNAEGWGDPKIRS